MPSTNPVDYGADPCGLRNSAYAISECLNLTGKCHFPVGTFLIGSTAGAKITSRFRFGGVATFTTATPHGLVVGEKITLYGFTDATFNGVGPTYYGFRVDAIVNSTTFTATVPGPNSGLVVEDGWINLIGGGFNSSVSLGYQSAINNLEIIGQGAGKTILKFADHTSTKIFDLYGTSAQMIKTIGTAVGSGTVGAPGSQKGNPTDATNCKNTLIQGITFDGNYKNNSVADVKIVSVQRTNGINTYTTSLPISLYSPFGLTTQFSFQPPPSYIPPLPPLYSNVSIYQQYISNVVTSGKIDDTFIGYGQVQNITQFSFQRDVRAILIMGRRNSVNQAIYTRHPNWYFPFTIGDTFTVAGFSDATLNGSFVVAGFLSADEVICNNSGPTTTIQINGFERLSGIAIYDTATPHGFVGGEKVSITNLSDPSFNGTFIVSGYPSPTQFTCINIGTDTGSIPDLGYVNLMQNAQSWSAPDVLPTPQVNAGANSVYTISGINHTGENAIIQDCEFYDFGDGTLNAESFVIKTFLPMTVDDGTPGAKILRNKFGYEGSNSIQGKIHPGSAEAITEVVIGGYSSINNPINIVSRSAGVATYTCVMKHTLRVGDVVVISGFSNGTFNGTFTITSIPDQYKFTAANANPDVLPGLYLDGFVAMLRSKRIFASECVIEGNKFISGPNRPDAQSPLHATTVRETSNAEIRYNNFNKYIGTCFYVDSFYHKGTHIHHNEALDVGAFIALQTLDYYKIYNSEFYSTFTAAHQNMLIENNDVLLSGPKSWYFQPSLPPIDAVFLLYNHDVDKSKWYYPTDYQIPITSVTRAANISTFTTASPHELLAGMKITVLGVLTNTFNGQYTVISTPFANTFTVANTGVAESSTKGFVGINSPVNLPWEIKPIGYQRFGGIVTYTTNKAHQLSAGDHATVQGMSDPSFNDEAIVIATPTLTTFTCANAGPDVPFVSETGNFFRYFENIQIGCNTARRLSGKELAVNNGGRFATFFISGRSFGCVAPLDQFFYFDCPEGCLELECEPGPCKPNDYKYRI